MKKLLALGAVLVVVLAGCSDKKESGGGGGQSDDAVAQLTAAKKAIDEASSVHIVLTGRDLPDSAQTLASGDGVATHAPAFKGKLTIRTGGSPIDSEVVAVDKKVYAKLPFTGSFIELTPDQLAGFGAPDPAILLDPATGLTAVLPALKDPKVKGETRDDAKVLTEITGAVTGKSLQGIFPKAPADQDFPSTFKLDKDSKQLVAATISGPFYDGATSSYDITFDRYGEQVEITKP
ncbi:LppX_LprAFG lipoprotein [Kribbella sandramycini]|uniref:Lipoprotein LprG n=1 Tax=Kribbella sandramycini TaxID=60450 RepID=A0A7Y4P064_9ACTN|nr:LppX_LprAFG lipoprotein [Kribbella sandramycini]MBB6569356.1 lipoprotein LprG [Kribbella sandramycini]NOL40805.1 LppX_LprAFG lipoprotein [Kribbella sandramycini]